MHYVDSDFGGFGGELTTIRWSIANTIVLNCFKRTAFDPLETDENNTDFDCFSPSLLFNNVPFYYRPLLILFFNSVHYVCVDNVMAIVRENDTGFQKILE